MQISITEADLDRAIEAAYSIGVAAGHEQALRGIPLRPRERAGAANAETSSTANVRGHMEAALAGRTGIGIDRLKRQQVIDAALGKLASFARGTV